MKLDINKHTHKCACNSKLRTVVDGYTQTAEEQNLKRADASTRDRGGEMRCGKSPVENQILALASAGYDVDFIVMSTFAGKHIGHDPDDFYGEKQAYKKRLAAWRGTVINFLKEEGYLDE